ncbi:exodeoxyribonuclease VII small subunit [Methylotenera sp.]|uniref:exodeoxyribonuclease VII small subunit n=1 Tax=Methylotenera sp. TaxID=2051956 RepID=UPI002488DA98|nr:exodeoxyribonuclease VII small subunit [Methylotenera sp.]MDI1362729.1 exodeoxyribonuclease VII small subunit [Methylotenera sp.]
MTVPKSKTAASLENNTVAPETFELAYAELESIVARMESGQMTLESSLAAYQRGNSLLQFCQKSLADVEQQVQILNERNQLIPFKSDDE